MMFEINNNTPADAKAVLAFWFNEINQAFWFVKNDDFDKLIKEKFLHTLLRASQGECDDWRVTIEGRLAEIIVLDQFSRNIFRNQKEAFTQDGMALILAQEAIAKIEFSDLPEMARNFVLLPFMHSESKAIHEKSLPYFKTSASKKTLDFEYQHKAIIDRFGRYPHRNAILGRTSTADELAFLQEPNSSF